MLTAQYATVIFFFTEGFSFFNVCPLVAIIQALLWAAFVLAGPTRVSEFGVLYHVTPSLATVVSVVWQGPSSRRRHRGALPRRGFVLSETMVECFVGSITHKYEDPKFPHRASRCCSLQMSRMFVLSSCCLPDNYCIQKCSRQHKTKKTQEMFSVKN